MRSFVAIGALLALSGPVLGADYLRGTHSDQPSYGQAPAFSWEGPYAGAFAAYTSANFDASRQSIALETQVLQGTVVQPNMAGFFRLGRTATTAFGGGIFIGYNWQFEDVVYGLEGEIAMARHTGTESRTNGGTFLNVVPNTFVASPSLEPAGTFTDAVTTGTTTNRIQDYAIVKARAGYAMGRLLPYISGGIGIARVQTTANATLTYATTQLIDNYNTIIVAGVPTRTTYINRTSVPVPAASGTRTAATSQTAFKAGVAVGIGIDWMPFENFFLRAEYQALLISSFERVDFQIHSARLGAGMKF